MATEDKLELTISPTAMAATFLAGTVAARVWKGRTGNGDPVAVLVLAVSAPRMNPDLERHLTTNPEVASELEIVSAEEAFQRVFSN